MLFSGDMIFIFGDSKMYHSVHAWTLYYVFLIPKSTGQGRWKVTMFGGASTNRLWEAWVSDSPPRYQFWKTLGGPWPPWPPQFHRPCFSKEGKGVFHRYEFWLMSRVSLDENTPFQVNLGKRNNIPTSLKRSNSNTPVAENQTPRLACH